MNLGTENWLVSLIISLLLMAVILILGRYFVKNKYTHISDLKNLAKYPDKYKLYLILLSVLVPGVEILFNLFGVREESQFISKLLVGFAFLGAYFASKYIAILSKNLHRLAVGAYLIFTLYDYYILACNPTDMIVFTELAGILVFSYYIFYNITHFFVYTFSCFLLLVGLYLYGRIDSKILVILDAIMVISLGLNYAKYIVERNVIANLFTAYNILNKGNLLVVGINDAGIVEYVSENIQTILGCNSSIIMGKKWEQELGNITGFQIENIELQSKKNYVQKFSCKNRTHKLIEWQEDASNNGLIIKIGRDVTESRLVQEKLAASNHQLKLLEQLINNASDSFLIAHENGQIFYLNQLGAERLGVKAEEAQLYSVQEIEPAFINNEAAWKAHVNLLKQEKRIVIEGVNINLLTKEPHPVEVNVSYTDVDGEGFVTATIRDITERKKIQSELKQLSLVAKKITNGVLIADMEGYVVWANDAYLNLLEVPMEILLNKRPRDLFNSDNNIILDKIAQVNGSSYTLELECFSYKKKRIWIEINNTVIKDDYDNPIQQIEIVTDITERKKAEAALKELSILQQGLLDNVPGYIGCKDYEGRFVFVNRSLADLFGKQTSEVVGLTDMDYGASEEEAQNYLKADREVIDSGKTLFIPEEAVLKKDGSRGVFQTIKVPVQISQHQKGFVLVVATDITERKQQELTSQERQKTLELHNKLLSKITAIPFEQYGTLKLAFQALTEAASNGLNVNRSSFWQCTKNSIICSDLYINDKQKHEEGIEILADDFPAYFRGLRSGLAIIADDAHTHPCTFEFSEVYLKPLGISSMLDVSVRINGEVIGVLCLEHITTKRNWTNDDVSFARAIADTISLVIEADRRKKAENELIEKQEQLQQLLDVTSNQNQRLQNFAHIVSHNIRSHSSNLTMLTTFLNEPEHDKEQQKFFQMLKLSTNKLAETVENLNEIITIQNNLNMPKTRLNIRNEIEKTMQALNTIILAEEVQVINHVAEEVYIKGLASYIESILLNMLTNAIKYRSPDRKAIIQFSAKRVGLFWQIAIQDNGLGIDLAKHGHKLFGMYKTFHKNADARGIGLFITKNQIEAMGGKIEVESKIGEGSTFNIYLYAND